MQRLGVLAGAVEGFFGGWVDLVLQRLTEIWVGLPVLFLLIIMASIVSPNFWNLLMLVALFAWMPLAQLVRAEVLRVRALDYVRAGRALGLGPWALMFRHMLPNALVATFSYLPFELTGAIATLAALDLIGYGMPPGAPSLGALLNEGRTNLQAPWLGLTGFFTLAIVLTLLTFLGEAVRDAFDPKREAGRPPSRRICYALVDGTRTSGAEAWICSSLNLPRAGYSPAARVRRHGSLLGGTASMPVAIL